MFNNLVIKQCQLVEARFVGSVATQRRYTFTEIPHLSRNNITVYGIEAYGATQLSTTPNNRTVVADADIDQIVVTLVDVNNEEFMYQQPAYSLIRSNNGGLVTTFEPRRINLTDCYIQCTSTSGISTDEVLAMTLYYDFA